jgi:hypothetical protein
MYNLRVNCCWWFSLSVSCTIHVASDKGEKPFNPYFVCLFHFFSMSCAIYVLLNSNKREKRLKP